MMAVAGVHVVAHHRDRPAGVARGQQRAQPDHLPLGAPHLELPDIADPVAEPLVGLDVHLPGPAELVEVVDVVRAQVELQRVEDVADRHAQGHALGPVDVEVEPGRVGPRAVEEALQARRPVAPRDDLVADPLQVAQAEIAAVFDDELEAAGRAQAERELPVTCRRFDAEQRMTAIMSAPSECSAV